MKNKSECTNEPCSQVNSCISVILKHTKHEQQILVYLVIKPNNPPSESVRAPHFAKFTQDPGTVVQLSLDVSRFLHFNSSLSKQHQLTGLNRTHTGWLAEAIWRWRAQALSFFSPHRDGPWVHKTHWREFLLFQHTLSAWVPGFFSQNPQMGLFF